MSRRRWWVAAGAAVLVALAVVGVTIVRRPTTAPAPASAPASSADAGTVKFLRG